MRSVRAVLGALLLPLCLSCGSSGSPRAVVLIVIDTLRADHLGCLGDTAAHTPNLDALAARGVLFRRGLTPVPITLPAITSLLTGRLPLHHGVRDNDRYTVPPKERTLAERFHDAGWKTGAVLASAILGKDRGLDQGFDLYDDGFTGPYPVYQPTLRVFADNFAKDRRRADDVTNRALATAHGFGKEPYFLFVHYFDVHSYYDPPPDYAALAPGRPYDGEIAYVDAEVGRLLDGLRDDHPLVVVVADHGEGLNQHGESEHGFLLYQSTLHVPVLAAGPEIPAGIVRDDPVSLIDVAPTLARDLGLPGGGPPADGRGLSWTEPDPDPPAFYAETFRTLISYGWSELRAVVDGDWKLIEGPEPELYNLARDPQEEHDLGDADPAPALRRKLGAITGGETRSQVLAALHPDVNPERKEVLEGLGYTGGTGATPADTLKEYPNPREELPKWMDFQRRKALYRKGVTLAVRGEYPAAIAIFDSVLAQEPGRADIYYNRGLAREHLGDEAGFLADLDRALQANPDYVPALASRALRAEKAGNLREASRGWTRVHELDPEHPGALRGLAHWYSDQDDWEHALPYLRALMNADPKDANAVFNAALAAMRVEKHEEARRYLERFLQLAPGDPRAATARELLKQMPAD